MLFLIQNESLLTWHIYIHPFDDQSINCVVTSSRRRSRNTTADRDKHKGMHPATKAN